MCFLPVANYFDVGRIKFGMSLPNLLMNKYLANYGKLLVWSLKYKVKNLAPVEVN